MPSNYIPKGNTSIAFTEGYDDGFDAGYDSSTADHTAVDALGLDRDGLPTGYNLGYEAASVYHTTNTVSGTDDKGRQRGYFEGYEDASIYHTTNTVSGNDALGRQRGYFEGYEDASQFHTTNSTSGNDALGVLRGYAEGYDDAFTPRWALRTTGNQTITNSAYTKVNFTATSSPTVGVTHSTSLSRITINESGTYEIAAGWEQSRTGASSSGTNIVARCAIYKNGSLVRVGDSMLRSSLNEWVMVCAREELVLSAGDYIEIYAFTNSNGTSIVEQVSLDSTDAFFLGFKR